MTSQKITVVALVENKPGVLNRVASMFRRRNFNVDSLTVGRTHKEHISRMTIVVDTGRSNAYLIASNLHKLINVIDVRILKDQPHLTRDLALIKVRTNDPDSYNGVTEICERYPARIVDMGPDVCIIEITASEAQIEDITHELRPIGILEMVRTGVVAMSRGTRIIDSDYEFPEPLKRVAKNGNGYHV
ncbi:MAG: acetolactate synthase small subunit [Chloroflexota bacterium]